MTDTTTQAPEFYGISSSTGMRHLVAGPMPSNDQALAMLRRTATPLTVCGRSLTPVNFYKPGAASLPRYTCTRCHTEPAAVSGTVVWEGTNTQVILNAYGFHARCTRCPWVTETVHGKYKARQSAEAHENS